jgi:hypothetical protein
VVSSFRINNIILIASRPIFDADSPKIADTFYGHLFRTENSPVTTGTSRPDTTQAARALHLSIAKLRSENISFIRWEVIGRRTCGKRGEKVKNYKQSRYEAGISRRCLEQCGTSACRSSYAGSLCTMQSTYKGGIDGETALA